MTVVTFYHDIEQAVNVAADPDACREALRSVLAIEAARRIRTTYNVVGALWKAQPDIVDWIRAGGHEVAFHSYHHELECPPERFAEEVELCRAHSAEPKGYRSPRSRWDQQTLRSCWQHGFVWNAESDGAGDPYFIYEKLVRLPIAGDDWPVFQGVLSPDEWVERFRVQLEGRNYVAIGVHDCVLSHRAEEMLAAWERCLDIALEAGSRVLTFGEAAQAHLDRAP